MSENTRKAERKAMINAARAARKEVGKNMFNPEVQLKSMKISNIINVPGEISYIPISNKTKKMDKINRLSQRNRRQVERYGLLPQDKGVILPSDPVFRAENLANTQITKSSSTSNKWRESGKGHILNPRESLQNRRSVLSQAWSLYGTPYRPTTPTARSINNAQRASELARTIHNKQVKRFPSSFSYTNPVSSVPRASIPTSQLPVETPTSVVNPMYPLGRGKRGGSSKTRKLKRASRKGLTKKIKSSKH